MKLKELRENLNFSQTQLAKKINVPIGTYNKWETNERTPKLEKLLMLANEFNVSLDYLVGRPFKEVIYLNNLSAEHKQVIEEVTKLDPVDLGKTHIFIQGLTGQLSF